jgi:hypothetical protein
MHQQGVSEQVISQMQQAPIGVALSQPATIIERPTTVIVEEPVPHYHVYPRVYHAYPHPPMRHYWR